MDVIVLLTKATGVLLNRSCSNLEKEIKMMKKYLILILTAFIGLTAFSQTYTIEVKVKGIKDSLAYLASYTGKDLLLVDTAVVRKDGSFTFTKEKLPHGVYAIVASMNPPQYFDFLLNETKISMETSLDKLTQDMVVKKSVENKLFFDYVTFLTTKNDLKKPILEEREEARKANNYKKIGDLEKKIVEIDQSVIDYQKKLVADNPEKYIGKLIKMSLEIEIPKPITEVKDTPTFNYEYYKNHFWDNVDLSDDRLGKSALFYNQMEKYFMNIIPQIPDTIINRIDMFLTQLPPNGAMMKSAIEFLAYSHVKTKLMGMESVYVHVCDTYILNGKCDWIGADKIEKIKPKVDKMRPVLIGKVAPNLILADTSEKKWINLHQDMTAEFTLLVFWSDECGHCKTEIPKYKKLYDSIKQNTNIDFDVFAVGTVVENDGWRKFIKENDLNWTNVSDFQDMRDNPDQYIISRKTDLRSINYRNSYDVFVTPIAFLLDKDNKIIAKQFDPSQLSKLLEFELEKKKRALEENKE